MRNLMVGMVVVAMLIGAWPAAGADEWDDMYLGLVDLDCVRIDFLSSREGPAADAMPAALRELVRNRLPGLAIRDDCLNDLLLSFIQPGPGCSNINLSVSRPVRIVGIEHAKVFITVVWTKGYTSTGGVSDVPGQLLTIFKDDYIRAGNKP